MSVDQPGTKDRRMPLKAVDISQTASASTIIFEAVRKAIITGELKDGEALRQDDLARMFRTSRIPVREALTRLEHLGLITAQRYRGAVVAGLSPGEAREIFDFRGLVEPEVVRHAVPRMTEADIEQARRYCRAFSDSTDPMEWGDLNRKFHETIYRASGMPYHMTVIDNAMDRVDRYLRAQLLMSDGMGRADEEHRGILAACEAGDADHAARLTAAHIAGARDSLLAHLETAEGGAPEEAQG